MKISIAIPRTRDYWPALESVALMDFGDHLIDTIMLGDAPDTDKTPWENLVIKDEYARKWALETGADALMLIEDDIIVPRNALVKLAALDADIAYGLTVWRHPPHHWSAHLQTGPTDDDFVTYDQYYGPGHTLMTWWGNVLDVQGCGLMCTLISREVLEKVNFRLGGWRAADWYFTLDAQAAGFTEKCDTSVVCGHIKEAREDGSYVIVEPNPLRGFKERIIPAPEPDTDEE